MLADKEKYLLSGIYIGMKKSTPHMKRFVFKTRDDGLSLLNLKKIDERIQIAGSFLGRYKKIMVVSRKENSASALEAFGKATNSKVMLERFSPGTLSNPHYKDFFEPDALIVCDPFVDRQALIEAKNKQKIPIVILCNTTNSFTDADLVIPLNNNSKKSLGITFWLLAREILMARGDLKKREDFKYTMEDFGG